jgi:hypothetical protein
LEVGTAWASIDPGTHQFEKFFLSVIEIPFDFFLSALQSNSLAEKFWHGSDQSKHSL